MFMLKTIMVICPDLPYPPIDGSCIDIWGHILFFHNQGWQIILVVCRTPEMLKIRCEEGRLISDSDINLPLDLQLYFFKRNSRWSSAEDPQTILQVQNLIDYYRPQVVWCEYADFGPLVSALNLNEGKLWFRPHNFEVAHAYEKAFEHQPWKKWRGTSAILKTLNWVKNLIHRLSRIHTNERLMYRIADRLFFISYGDMRAMSWFYWRSVRKDWVVPFLVRDQMLVKESKTPLDVAYLGSNYKNNINMAGALTLLHEIIPAVETAMPGAFRFHLVGKNSSELQGHYSSTTVIIHDFIDDLHTFLQDIDIACLPVKLGWGCKIKMIEMLAYGIPMIGAPQTFRGIPIKTDAYYSCRTSKGYMEAFRRLLPPHNRERMGRAGREVYATWFVEGQRILQDALKIVEGMHE